MSALSAVEPERGIVPREVFCVIEQAHRDVALAEDASEGRFTIAGVTVGPGPDPDWMGAALPPDDEWRIEWTKFYYGLDLAHAYRVTGEARFLHAWERLVAGFIAQVPIGEGVDSSDVAARRVQNWIYAWASFAAAPGFRGLRDDLEEELLSSVREHIAFIRHDLTPERNHRTLELYALLVVALALPALDEDGALLELATAELHKNLLTDVRSDGVHREHSTHYHLIALRSFVGARENARRFGIALPAGYDEHLSLACDFAMHCQRPDGAIPALSDSDNGRYGDVLALAGELLHRDDLRWVASAGADGSPPQRRHVSFPAGGYHVQRSGWGDRGRAYADERFLIFDCGPLGDGGHGHYDVLSVEIAAGGRPLVVDPGRYTYDEQAPNLRHWFKGTAAHNTVVVDGHDQAPYRRGKPRQGTLPSARLLERHTAPGLDVVRGQVTSTCYDAVHTRRIAFVADEYWVLEDLLAGERPHRYDLRFHLAADAWGRVAVECRDASYVVRAPGVALVVAADRAPVIEAGWVAPAYGVKLRAPVVSVVAAGAATTFTTLVVPLDDGAPAPEMTVRNDGDATAVEIAGERHRDTVLWSRGPGTIEVEQLGRHARAGFMRQDGASASAVAAGVGSRPEWMTWSARDGRATGREGEL
ncbi:MAG: hypothetical protein QOH46_952 [Solirubrobacteraceae bacterium]|nr:hypothetical protein [Solirubrobacteraceae bacterium]